MKIRTLDGPRLYRGFSAGALNVRERPRGDRLPYRDRHPWSEDLCQPEDPEIYGQGGRVSPAKGLLATLLNLKPIITVDEEGFARSFGQTRGWEANVNKIREIIDQECRKARVWNYCIVHAHSPASAEAAASGMRETVGRDPAYVMDISPVLGAHSGIGSVAVGILME